MTHVEYHDCLIGLAKGGLLFLSSSRLSAGVGEGKGREGGEKNSGDERRGGGGEWDRSKNKDRDAAPLTMKIHRRAFFLRVLARECIYTPGE